MSKQRKYFKVKHKLDMQRQNKLRKKESLDRRRAYEAAKRTPREETA